MSKTYLVTGANRGLGLEFAKQLSARGDTVIGTSRSIEKAGALRDLGARCRVVALDVTDPGSIAGLGERVGAGAIDVLINNAGVSSTSKSVGQLDAAEMQRVFMVNSVAPLLVTGVLLPQLRSGRGKLIVQITSQLGSIANNTGGSTYAYRGSKAALNQMNKCLANELGPEGFRCVAVHPGWVRTDMGGPSAHLSPEESVRAMLKTIDGAEARMNGAFVNYDGGVLPW